MTEKNENQKVLIIDDEGDLVELLVLRLAESGFLVDVALNGKKGMKKVKSFKPDVILLDIMMPEMDGWQVCSTLRDNPENDHIKVVMFSAHRENLKKAKEVGADQVILKPFNIQELIAALKSPVKRKK